MRKKSLYKSGLKTISNSLGRYLAILILMMIGAFAFAGLKMAGPDMRTTAQSFYRKHQLADLTISSNYGLNKIDRKTIKQQTGIKRVEFGYLQDTEIVGKDIGIRILSDTKAVSTYQLDQGRLPKKKDEIALSTNWKKDYKLGSTIKVRKKANLKTNKFKVVGFVTSSEYLDKNSIAQSNFGNGQVELLAVVDKNAFTSNIYQIARINYQKTQAMNPFGKKYNNFVENKSDQLLTALNKNRKRKYRNAQRKIDQTKVKLVQAQKLGVKLPQVNKKLVQAEHNLKIAGYPYYTIADRSENPGYEVYRSNATRVDILANVFPIIMFAIALLVTLTTMTRFVEEDRINIGTLRALGYSKFDIAQKFLLYSLSSTILGVILGACLGFKVLPEIIFRAYASNSTMPNFRTVFSWYYFIWILALSVLLILGAVLVVLRNDFKEKPAQLLLPKPPKNGKRIILERIKPIWTRMSFNHKVTARNLFRYKTRMLMTIFGVAGCTGLLVMGFGIRDSLSGINRTQFNEIIKYDLINVEQPDMQDKAKLEKVLQSKAVLGSLNVNFQQMTKRFGQDDSVQTINVIAVNDPKKLPQFVGLKDNGKTLKVNNQGVIISRKMANLLHAKKGSMLVFKTKSNKKIKMKISAIADMYIGHYIFMNSRMYRDYFGKKFSNNAQLIKLKNDSSLQVDQFSKQLIDSKQVITVNQNKQNKKLIATIIKSLDRVIIVLIVLATILALVVIYSLTNANLSERIRELSTLKVLGFFDSEATMYIYRETILLSCIGIIVGFALGIVLHQFIIQALPPNNAMFDPKMKWTNFVLSSLVPIVITLMLVIVVERKIKTVNMLEALKSVD